MLIYKVDSEIKKDILAELKWNPQIHETDIGVIVKNGAVTLTGNVPTFAQKMEASRVAGRIKGVIAIADDIEVKLPAQMYGTDEAIGEHIAASFSWDSVIPADDIKAEVRNGFVTLKGDVDWQYQRDYAQRKIAGIKGVRMVLNNLNIRKHASIPDIKTEIIKALHRHATVEAHRINITVSNGIVTLNGIADNYFEKNLIRGAVWAAPGVRNVVNNITISPSFREAA